jgi:hypothetical protein
MHNEENNDAKPDSKQEYKGKTPSDVYPGADKSKSQNNGGSDNASKTDRTSNDGSQNKKPGRPE